MKPSRSIIQDVRGLRYHVRTWGKEAHPRIFLLHGFLDVSASFQFLVDAFRREWYVLAPDWRGFGLSEWQKSAYFFADYIADLDLLLERFSPHEPARLIGHSMGGNVACIYAGVRPERVDRLVTLEGFGLPPADPADAPRRYRRWLVEISDPPRFRPYATFDALAERLIASNPRLARDRAAFLARHCGKLLPSGEVVFNADPMHKAVSPVSYRLEEVMACWRQVRAPVLWVEADGSTYLQRYMPAGAGYSSRKACFARLTEAVIAGAGHMMHHDQPQQVAKVIESFLSLP